MPLADVPDYVWKIPGSPARRPTDNPSHFADMDKPEVRVQIVEAVKTFNDFFCQLCDDIHVVDRFLVDQQSLMKFRELVNKDLEHHLINGWNFVNKNEPDRTPTDLIEDTVFFYPVIGSIRDNLIENL